MNIEIKKTERRHMDDVIHLIKRISPYGPKKKYYDNIWSSFIQQPNVYSLVATKNDIVLGYGSGSIEMKIRGGKIGHIEDIVVHSEHEKKGISKKILESLYKIAKKDGCFKIILQCKNEHNKFYEKCYYNLSGSAMRRFID